MPVQKLTDDVVANMACPEGRAHIEFFDTLLRGLYVDVLANGRMSYRVRYRHAGKSQVCTLGDARLLTLAEAREQARQVLRKALAGVDPKAAEEAYEGPTVEEFFLHQYLPFVKSYKRSWSTDETMIRLHLLPALGERFMSGLSPPDIARVMESMRSRGYAAGSVNRVLVLLRYGFALAMRWRVSGIDRNPAKELKNLKEDNRIERFLTAEQTVRLLDAVRRSPNPQLGSIVAFLIHTGARKREALDAQWKDIDWWQKSWRIPKTKSGKVRHVPLSVGALQVLKAQQALQARELHQSGYVFSSLRTGLPFVSIFYSWDSARKQAGLPDLRIHDLRHSFASFLVNAGHSLYEVQALLGHADIRTTTRYAHLSRERLQAAVEAVPCSSPEGWDYYGSAASESVSATV